AEERGVLDAGVNRVRIGQRGLEVPDPFELPGVRRAVVPLMRAGHALVDKLVVDGLPGLAAVVRTLDLLPEPAARLRRVDAVGIDRRSLEVIQLPAAEERPADVPALALAVRGEDEGPLARPDEHSHSAHVCSPPGDFAPLTADA